jgi:hypothetical protein
MVRPELAGMGFNPGQGGEGSFVAQSSAVGPGGQRDGSADRADAGLIEQDGAHRGD